MGDGRATDKKEAAVGATNGFIVRLIFVLRDEAKCGKKKKMENFCDAAGKLTSDPETRG